MWRFNMSKKHPVKPEKNFEYTFIFSGNVTHTLRYCGMNQEGKYVFENVKTKRFTKPMTARRFDYMIERQLKSICFIQDNGQTTSEEGKQELDLDRLNLQRLERLSPEKKREYETKYNFPFNVFFELYECAIRCNDKADLQRYRAQCKEITTY